jgi:hypothetical protein
VEKKYVEAMFSSVWLGCSMSDVKALMVLAIRMCRVTDIRHRSSKGSNFKGVNFGDRDGQRTNSSQFSEISLPLLVSPI